MTVSQLEHDPTSNDFLSEINEDILTQEVVSEVKSEEKSDLFAFLGRAYMLEVLHEFVLDPGPWRFSELRTQLDVPPTTLTNRLKDLTNVELVVRKSYDEIPPRVEYTATKQLLDFRAVFRCLGLWVTQHGWNSARSETPE